MLVAIVDAVVPPLDTYVTRTIDDREKSGADGPNRAVTDRGTEMSARLSVPTCGAARSPILGSASVIVASAATTDPGALPDVTSRAARRVEGDDGGARLLRDQVGDATTRRAPQGVAEERVDRHVRGDDIPAGSHAHAAQDIVLARGDA